jgi:integrase
MRPRKHDRHLPSCVFYRHGAYFLVKAGKWTRLGADLRTALIEYARRQAQTPGGMVQLIEQALPEIVADKRPATVKLYTLAARRLQEILAEFSPAEVTPQTVAQLRRGLKDTPVMANKCVMVLKMVYQWALENGEATTNPCIGIAKFKETKRTRRITREEFAAIRQHASERLQVVMDLCYLTGQRIGDVLKIQRRDLTDAGVYIRQQKTDAELTVAWSPELRAAVERAKAQHGSVARMRLVPWAYRTIHEDWTGAVLAAGVEHATLHDLRAMSATELDQQGGSAQALLGHTNPRMTERYLRDADVPVVSGPSIGQSKTGRGSGLK